LIIIIGSSLKVHYFPDSHNFRGTKIYNLPYNYIDQTESNCRFRPHCKTFHLSPQGHNDTEYREDNYNTRICTCHTCLLQSLMSSCIFQSLENTVECWILAGYNCRAERGCHKLSQHDHYMEFVNLNCEMATIVGNLLGIRESDCPRSQQYIFHMHFLQCSEDKHIFQWLGHKYVPAFRRDRKLYLL
jgi:hypothetical protein